MKKLVHICAALAVFHLQGEVFVRTPAKSVEDCSSVVYSTAATVNGVKGFLEARESEATIEELTTALQAESEKAGKQDPGGTCIFTSTKDGMETVTILIPAQQGKNTLLRFTRPAGNASSPSIPDGHPVPSSVKISFSAKLESSGTDLVSGESNLDATDLAELAAQQCKNSGWGEIKSPKSLKIFKKDGQTLIFTAVQKETHSQFTSIRTIAPM